MDFSNRSTQAQPVAPSAHAAAGPGASRKNSKQESKWGRIGVVVSVAVLVVFLVFLTVFIAKSNSSASGESKIVDSNKLQAVFLNTGQVYFGHIKTLNNKYFVVTNIYYLQTSNGSTSTTSNANTSVSLVKLGCELHEPYDQMVINRDQVTFWENLQDGGQVAKAVTTFQKQNPNGQKCADQSNSSTNTSNSVQSAGTNSGSTTTTNSSSTTKP